MPPSERPAPAEWIAGRGRPVVEVEVVGAEALGADAPPRVQVQRLCVLAAVTAGVDKGHLAIEFVDDQRIARLNAEHRGKQGPTDVLSFPIDGAAPIKGAARELGDVMICPDHTADVREAIIHGVLHLVGMDHESDQGEMLAVQAELLRWEGLPASAAATREQP
jgi:probable rRNA maturation factor